MGGNAIQLAVNAGYDVVTTASPRNFAYARRLGAGEVFDYHSDTAVKDIIRFLAQVPPLAGAIAVGRGSARACMETVDAVPGAKTLASASPSVATATQRPRARRRGIRVKSIWGSSLKDNEVGPAIYRQFLPRALSAGAYVPAPDPLVAGHGLEHIQTALDALKRGVSARKVVITL